MSDLSKESTPAYLDGWFAHRQQQPLESNPYNPYSQHMSSQLWSAGWCERFSAVKHGKRTAELDDTTLY